MDGLVACGLGLKSGNSSADLVLVAGAQGHEHRVACEYWNERAELYAAVDCCERIRRVSGDRVRQGEIHCGRRAERVCRSCALEDVDGFLAEPRVDQGAAAKDVSGEVTVRGPVPGRQRVERSAGCEPIA